MSALVGVPAVMAVIIHVFRRRRKADTVLPPPDIAWDKEGKCWLVCGYNDVLQLIRSPHIKANYLPSFTSCLSPEELGRFDFLVDFFSRWPLFQDGADQRRVHGVLAELFTAARVENMQGIIDAAVEETIHPLLEERGSWDAVARFAKPLPLRVILAVIGLPSSDAADMQRWADDVEEWFGGHGDAVGRFDRCQVCPRPARSVSDGT